MRILLTFIFLLLMRPAFADTTLAATSFYDGEKVLLRWVPADLSTNLTYTVVREDVGTVAQTRRQTLDEVKALPESKEILSLLYPVLTATSDAEKIEAAVFEAQNKALVWLTADMNPVVAKALGVFAEDKAVQRGVHYRYRIAAFESGVKVAEEIVDVDTFSVTQLVAPEVKATGYSFGNALRWTRYDTFTAFHIYRSSSEKGPFEKITRSPVMVTTEKSEKGVVSTSPYFYTDSTVKGDGFWYLVTGVDPFGQESPRSIPVKVVMDAIDRPVAPQALLQVAYVDGSVKLSWAASPLKGVVYAVYRSGSHDGEYIRLSREPLLRPEFTDRTAVRNTNYFYTYTQAVPQSSESLPSVPVLAVLQDRTPPARVSRVRGESKKATAIIEWEDVCDSDLAGYNIYRADDKDALDWAKLNGFPVQGTVWSDRMDAALDGHPYFYKVVAVDRDQNAAPASDIVEIRLPDVTPPTAPSLPSFTSGKSGIVLSWEPSASVDCKGYRIFRGMGNKRVELTRAPVFQTSLADPSYVPGYTENYFIVAEDAAGNRSSELQMEVFIPDTKAPQITSLTAVPDGAVIRLAVASPDTDLSGFEVFRRRDSDRAWKRIGYARGMTYIDRRTNPFVGYVYKVRLYDLNGNTAEKESSVIRR